MLERALAPLNRWALDHIDRQWVDYVASNTMTELNRRLNSFIWTYELKAQVVQVIDEAPDVKTFVLRPNQHWRGMKPGQYIELIVSIDGQELRRHYSPTILPRGRLSITVKTVELGRVSNWLHRSLRPGMLVRIGHPQGRFVMADQPKVLFLCAGSGITPCHAMVTDLLAKRARGQSPDIQVMAQFRLAHDVIYKQALRRWAQQGVKVTTALSGASAQTHAVPGLSQRLDAQRLLAQCPDLLQRDIYLCGPAGFMAQMVGHLRALNVDMARVHTERFVTVQSVALPTGDFKVAGAEVFFQHLGETITMTAQDQGKSLLEVARAHGVNVESGCCQGMCGTCRLTVHDGLASGNVLGKVVYLCTAYPASSRLVLDA